MISTILTMLASSLGIYVAIALLLIASQSDVAIQSTTGLDFDTVPQSYKGDVDTRYFDSRDGARHRFRRFESGVPDAPLLVLIHGSGWHGDGYLPLAAAIAKAGASDVLVPDLRGHGPEAVTRGDVAYIGQLEDDIADLVRAESRPGQEVVLAGHSSGGGLVIRFAERSMAQ